MCMLVNRVKDEIASELVHNLYAQITSLETLLRETDDVASRRRELMEQLAVLNRGIGILNEIRDAGIMAAPPTAGGAGAAGELLVGAGMGAGVGAGAGSEGYGRGDKGAAAAAPAPYSSRSHPQGSSPGSGAAEGEEGGVGRGSLSSGAAKGGGAGGIGRRSLETHASAVPSQAPPRLGSNAGV